ncbi:DUF2020 domain-containing protein [Corynebacterium frankenforstense]
MLRSLPRRLPRLSACVALGAVAALTACATQEAREIDDAAPTTAATDVAVGAPDSADPGAAAPDGLPVAADPEVPGGRDNGAACPYLDAEWVARTNGQKVTGQGTDARFTTPACVFWSYGEDPQLQVSVRHMPSPEEATAVVNRAAPIERTNPAEEIDGWSGGRAGGELVEAPWGALYAVAKGPMAVVVFSDQAQSVKAEAVAREVIANLGL